MNKRGLRAFALGMIFAVSIIGTYYFYFTNQSQAKFDETAAKKQLIKKGYVVLTATEYHNIEQKVTNRRSAATKEENNKSLKKQNNNSSQNQVINYPLKVVSGMSSGDIAALLVKHNIIENGNEFEQFLITHHFATKIQLGTYQLTNKMDYQEIAKLITK